MAKAILAYVGFNSVGASVRVAQSENGAWYYREYGFNGYGKGWSKWEKLDWTPSFFTEFTNPHTGETYQAVDPTAKLEWGFGRLDRLDEQKWRLPN